MMRFSLSEANVSTSWHCRHLEDASHHESASALTVYWLFQSLGGGINSYSGNPAFQIGLDQIHVWLKCHFGE